MAGFSDSNHGARPQRTGPRTVYGTFALLATTPPAKLLQNPEPDETSLLTAPVRRKRPLAEGSPTNKALQEIVDTVRDALRRSTFLSPEVLLLATKVGEMLAREGRELGDYEKTTTYLTGTSYSTIASECGLFCKKVREGYSAAKKAPTAQK
jgi:hypothetical protein